MLCSMAILLFLLTKVGLAHKWWIMPGSLGKVQKKKRHGYMTPHTGVEDLRNDKSNWNMFSFGIPKFLTLILELSLTCSLLRTKWNEGYCWKSASKTQSNLIFWLAMLTLNFVVKFWVSSSSLLGTLSFSHHPSSSLLYWFGCVFKLHEGWY